MCKYENVEMEKRYNEKLSNTGIFTFSHFPVFHIELFLHYLYLQHPGKLL